jgi:hypothetical protein
MCLIVDWGDLNLTLLLLACCALDDIRDGRARDLRSSGACDDAAALGA